MEILILFAAIVIVVEVIDYLIFKGASSAPMPPYKRKPNVRDYNKWQKS